MKKRIFIIGNDANAYALAKNLSKQHDIFIAPSSDTLSEFAETADIREDAVKELLEYAVENEIDMTIVVSKAAVEADIASLFARHNQLIFAPSANAAEIILNKVQAKKVMYKLRIPTPKFGIFEKENFIF